MSAGARFDPPTSGRGGVGALRALAVILDRAGALEVVEQDRLDVERDLDLVADDYAAPGELVLPRDAEVVPVDPGDRLEADPAQLALALVAEPERRRPLAEVVDIESDRAGDTADRQFHVALEGRAGGALGEAPAEADPRVMFDVEEVGAAQVLVALRLAAPEPGGVDLAREARIQTVGLVELECAVDVLEVAAHPGDHHVPRAELGRGVPRFEQPGRHQGRSRSRVVTTKATSSR